MLSARRIAASAVVLLLAAGIAVVLTGDQTLHALHSSIMDEEAGAAPDYSQTSAWAAHPRKADRADATPLAGTRDEQADAIADVFFVYAAANGTLHWNVPIADPVAHFMADGPLIEQWASVFNGCCRVYVPRFRQESMMYPDDPKRFEQALDLAFEDVRAAFRHYLEHENQGRPIVIAGAQSGGRHALRLLTEEFASRPVRAQLVAAYLVGARVDAEARRRLGEVPICESPTQLGCVNSWNTTGRQAYETVESRDGETCTNPLSWRADEVHVPAGKNLGSIGGRLFGSGPLDVESAVIDAQCEHGRLWVTPPEDGMWRLQLLGPGDYHIQNYMFFYGNIRANARERAAAFAERS